jgi:catalase
MNNSKEQETAANAKNVDLEVNRENSSEQYLTTNQGLRINDDQNSLKAGDRGPSLLEDFHFREKMTHFDHERIPERVVHARGSGAHGYFEVYESMAKYTRARFLQNPGEKTPVFVRFSTVVGSRGSTDLARDVRGFSTKFYTDEGNYDLVANNIPVFFIQDAVKFPDLVHSIKPEPDNEIPQASAAHDTFWDFISVMPESMHMIMWAMSDRAIPRSYRMMEGFGVHTFKFINENNEVHFVKLHWKPVLGVHSVTWDEAQKISGKDPDFHRRDLYEAIENGDYPEFELGVQLVPEKDEHKFNFDLLDSTKLIPEELVPVKIIGKMTLNRNPDNFFAETEQIAFHPGHIVPGIDFTNDPLLQGRLFSYLDTQLIRLGGPNFHEIPINRPVAPVHNNQRDGYSRQTINKGKTSYGPNTIGGGCPFQARFADGGFTSHTEHIATHKVRSRSKSFFDHFSQARLFYQSQSVYEQNHIVEALRFELGKVKREDIRERMVGLLNKVDRSLADKVATGLGITIPESVEEPINRSIPADGNPDDFQPVHVEQEVATSKALSMEFTKKDSIKTRKIAILAANGVDSDSLTKMNEALTANGAMSKLVSSRQGYIHTANGAKVKIDESWLTTSSVEYDAVFIPDGADSVNFLKEEPEAIHFINEAYKHCKPIAAPGLGKELLVITSAGKKITQDGDTSDSLKLGIVLESDPQKFVEAIAQHRFWEREKPGKVPA